MVTRVVSLLSRSVFSTAGSFVNLSKEMLAISFLVYKCRGFVLDCNPDDLAESHVLGRGKYREKRETSRLRPPPEE